MGLRLWKNTLRVLPLLIAGLCAGGLTFALLRGLPVQAEVLPPLRVDDRELAALRHMDATLRAESRDRVPDHVRAVENELAELSLAYARYMARGRSGAGETEVPARLGMVRTAVAKSIADTGGSDPLRPLMRLRARQYEAFQAEFSKARAAGKDSDALLKVGAQFLLRMREIGYIRGYESDLSADEMATLYKLAWNTSIGMDVDLGWAEPGPAACRPYKLGHGHHALALALALRRPVTNVPADTKPSLLARIRDEVLIGKIADASRFDPRYPTDYALGMTYMRLGRNAEARQHFESALASGQGAELRIHGYLLTLASARVD